MKKQLNIPKFKNESEERKYWQSFDASNYLEASDFSRVTLPNLMSTSEPISIRMPKHLLMRVKEQANKTLIPYQALIKMYIQKGIENSSRMNKTSVR